ncbi:hypothetical protein [Sphingomonas sp. CFBP 13706]|uniref:hypothetical protein n=1 Tax=Sphingomonas sp. CFBP 13706 TaxID=2775314 RepID=UPI001786F82A|nr:hypothetical protein [Sphingomonas sp. CFBP 13706]MBD8736856.1 hypothetical protein [Sphingomonas sp. CFBP 13706]
MQDSNRLPLITNPTIQMPFVYQSYRNLARVLGSKDALGAGLFLAASHFIDISKRGKDPQALTKRLNKKYIAYTGNTDLDLLLDHLISLLIVATSKHFEDFLERFRKEQYAMGRRWPQRPDGVSDLKWTLSALQGGFELNRKRIGVERYDLIEYFRLIRNSAAHPADDMARNYAEHGKVLKYTDILKANYKFQPPGRYGELTFPDHLLYTILVKFVAVDICRLAPPETASELIVVLANREWFPSKPVSVISRRSPTDDTSKAVRHFFKSVYNYDFTNRVSVESELIQWIKALPNQKERKRKNWPSPQTDLMHYVQALQLDG